jgi:hypothetical protein
LLGEAVVLVDDQPLSSAEGIAEGTLKAVRQQLPNVDALQVRTTTR